MSRAGVDAAPKGSAALVGQQRQVLRLVRYLDLAVAVPVLGVQYGISLGRGDVAMWLGLDFAIAVLLGVALTLERERDVRRAGLVLFAGTLALTILALLHFGPTLGVGALLCTCALAYSFFLRGVLVPGLVVLGAVLGVGLGIDLGVLRVDWWSEVGGFTAWTREMITLAVVVLTVTVTFDRMVAALELAIQRESEARLSQQLAQAEREASLEATAKSQRLEALGRLAGGVAHDFNNALSVLSGGMEYLRDPSGQERDEMVSDMEAAVRRAADTTRQLLSLARQGSTLGETALPDSSLQALARNLQRIFPENIQIQVHADPVPRVALSSGEFEQAVLNLCLNARDAMPEGGTLDLRCAELDQDAENQVLVEVSDSGVGMSEQTLARAIEPLFSTKPAGRGTGFGLSMVERTVSRIGGRVEIRSTFGKGTTVRLLLPTAPADLPGGRASAPSGRRQTVPRARVLLLEDEPLVRRALTRCLRQGGHTVMEADSVRAALRAIDDGDYDVLVTDGVLSDGECSPVVARFRETPQRLVIVCSGYVPESGLLREIEAGAVVFLPKPVQPGQLLRCVSDGLDALSEATPGVPA